MIRRIIKIDENKCNACGLCVNACHESAIAIIEGKAKLTRDDYCDGLGDCLPACPTGAISFIEKDTLAYNEAEVLANKQKNVLHKLETKNWPIQLKLVSEKADFFNGADLLITADCTAYAYANFHKDFMQNKVTLIACPKLDMTDYTQKLHDIIYNNNIQSLSVVRMEVPCCSGIANFCLNALKNSKKDLPINIITISLNGQVLSNS